MQDSSSPATCVDSTRNSDQLRLLIEVSEAVATHRDLTTLFRDLARRLPVIVPFEFIALFLHDPEKNVMRVDMLGTADADSIPPGLEVPLDQSYSGLVFTTQQSVIVNSLAETRFPIAAALSKAIGAESFCILPLTTTVRRIGAMAFGSTSPHAFDESELEYLRRVTHQVAVAVDNVLHSESARATQTQLSQERDRLRLLLEVSESIASHRHLNDLFQDLAERLPRVIPFDYINLNLHDSTRDVMRLHILVVPEDRTILRDREIPVDGSASGWVWKTQQPVVVEDLDTETRFPVLVPMLRENGVKSFCSLPLTTALRRLGALGFGSMTRRGYTEADQRFMQQVTNQVAVAVDNVMHAESARDTQTQLRQERDRLQLLVEVSESIASHRNLNDLFHDLADRLPRVVSFDYINLLLHDPARNVMRLHILVAPESSTIRRGQEFPVDGSASGLVWKTQQPLVVEELEKESRFPVLVSMLRENGVQSACWLPLTTAFRRLGTLGFGSLTRRAYTEAEQHFMQQVTNQVAVAVDNVLHDESAQVAQHQLTRERDRLRLLLEVNNAVVSHLDLDDVFKAVSACLRRVIPCDGSSLLLWDAETGQYRVYVLRFRHGDHFVEEGRVTDPHRDKSPSGIAITSRRTTLFDEQQLREVAVVSKAAERILAEGVKSFCCVPLLSHDRVLGALNVGSFEPHAFAEDHVELLGDVGKQIAIAVENGLAFRQIADLQEKLKIEKLYLEDEIRNEQNFDEIIGQSAALKQVLQQIEIVAPTDSTVLIQGETGTGKELIARAIHNLSERRTRTFVKVNCAAIPTGLLESELFGHEKGAFTGAIAQKIGRFELAHGGTLFLDEVGDIPLELQSKFLRVLQEQEFERLGGTRTMRVDTRLVAATNRDLTAMVDDKEFRSDLYYRLNVFPILSPPLRDRREDIGALVRHFTQKFARKMKKHIEAIPIETMATLTRYRWPGNIRELENVIERAVILSRGSTLDVPLAEMKVHIKEDSAAVDRPQATLEDAEREHIRQALEQAHWLVGGPSGAAARLGMKRTTLQSKMAKLGIERPSSR